MMHANIPVFVPHLGCPHACVFCDQKTITGSDSTALASLEDAIARAGASSKDRQIAFFGGSFTAIAPPLMIALLERAAKAVKDGVAFSIRLSTRPDAIDEEILGILKRYPVTTVELGIQSTSDRVLQAAGRGHSAAQSAEACRRIRAFGLEAVGQMMIGLPGSTLQDEIKTAQDILSFGCTAARIYPTVVFPGTGLAVLADRGDYEPLTLSEAVKRSAAVYRVFASGRCPVIRIGLCESEGLRIADGLRGAYHPALGEMVLGEYFFQEIRQRLGSPAPTVKTVRILTPPHTMSQAVGYKKSNRTRLAALFPHIRFVFRESPEAEPNRVTIITKET